MEHYVYWDLYNQNFQHNLKHDSSMCFCMHRETRLIYLSTYLSTYQSCNLSQWCAKASYYCFIELTHIFPGVLQTR